VSGGFSVSTVIFVIDAIGSTAAMICGMAVIMLIRFAAAYYKLNLPKIHN